MRQRTKGRARRQDRSSNVGRASRPMPLAFLRAFSQLLAGFCAGTDQKWIGLAQMALSPRFGQAAFPASRETRLADQHQHLIPSLATVSAGFAKVRQPIFQMTAR